MLEITPVNDGFVAEVTGLDLATEMTEQIESELKDALEKYAVLVMPGQILDEEQQLRVAKVFGPLEVSVGASVYNAKRPRRLNHSQLSDISNLDESGAILEPGDIRRLINLSNQLWHTDSSFKKTPASASLLYAQEVTPVGGATEFADMRSAWDSLDASLQAKVHDMVAVHDYFYSRSLTGFDLAGVPQEWRDMQPPAQQVLVRTNSRTQRKSLYLASHIRHIEGLSEEQSRPLLEQLMQHATRPEHLYRHRWRQHDLVIWDNRTTMHRGQPFDEKYRRSMRRATAQDEGPTVQS